MTSSAFAGFSEQNLLLTVQAAGARPKGATGNPDSEPLSQAHFRLPLTTMLKFYAYYN